MVLWEIRPITTQKNKWFKDLITDSTADNPSSYDCYYRSDSGSSPRTNGSDETIIRKGATRNEKEFEESMKEQINKILENHAAAAPVLLVQTTTTNIIDNRTNNNITININTFGDENIDYIDDKAWLSYINRCYKSIPYLLERIHFDPKHPENHNIRTTNKKLPYTSVVGKNKKRRIMDRKDAVETMVQNGFIIIDEKYTELKDRLPSSKQQNYEGFQTLFEAQDKELMKRLHKDIDMLLLNGGNC